MSKKKKNKFHERKKPPYASLVARGSKHNRQAQPVAQPVANPAPGPTQPMVTLTPREQNADGAAHESVPAPVVMVFQSELDYISRCILDYPDIETGGQLFGHWTAQGVPVVEYAIGPGPRANHQPTFFNQDVDYLVRVGQELVDKFGLQHIGEWHSHHRLGLAQPSGHDAATMVNNIARLHLRRFLLCIGNCDLHGRSTVNAYTFHEDHSHRYVHAPWHVMPVYTSPYRADVDRALAALLEHPRTQRACLHEMLLDAASQSARPEYETDYWLADKANNAVLKRIIDQLPMLDQATPCSVQPKLDEHRHLHLIVQRGRQSEHIYFPPAFPREKPQITFSTEGRWGLRRTDTDPTMGIEWNYTGDIYRAFMDYYKRLF